MAQHISGGVQNAATGERIPTKAALRRAVRDNPALVYFRSTDLMGEQFEGTVDTMPEGDMVLNVCGPDPHNNRGWYASIKRGRNGLVVT